MNTTQTASKRIAAIEATVLPPVRPELTPEKRRDLIVLYAALVAYWLGDDSLAPFPRLYDGVCAAHLSQDAHSEFRQSFPTRFSNAMIAAVHKVAPGKPSGLWECFAQADDQALSTLLKGLATLLERHPALDWTDPGKDRHCSAYMRIKDGVLVQAQSELFECDPIEAFAIDAWEGSVSKPSADKSRQVIEGTVQ